MKYTITVQLYNVPSKRKPNFSLKIFMSAPRTVFIFVSFACETLHYRSLNKGYKEGLWRLIFKDKQTYLDR